MGEMQSVPEVLVQGPAPLSPSTVQPSRHSALVRATHWITALSFLALLVSGIEILISHPRFYWGENGNVLTPVLFKLPIPSSRSLVPTGYGYVLPDQNGWSRYLHFQSAWLPLREPATGGQRAPGADGIGPGALHAKDAVSGWHDPHRARAAGSDGAPRCAGADA